MRSDRRRIGDEIVEILRPRFEERGFVQKPLAFLRECGDVRQAAIVRPVSKSLPGVFTFEFWLVIDLPDWQRLMFGRSPSALPLIDAYGAPSTRLIGALTPERARFFKVNLSTTREGIESACADLDAQFPSEIMPWFDSMATSVDVLRSFAARVDALPTPSLWHWSSLAVLACLCSDDAVLSVAMSRLISFIEMHEGDANAPGWRENALGLERRLVEWRRVRRRVIGES